MTGDQEKRVSQAAAGEHSSPGRTLDTDALPEIHRRMLRIRFFEEAVKRASERGEVPGGVHLSIGQEAEVVGSCFALREDDFMTGNHRSHGHPIGKGAHLAPLMAEIFGRSTGVCRGRGGSMHLADFSVGSLGESGVVGSAIPIATGAALRAKVRGDGPGRSVLLRGRGLERGHPPRVDESRRDLAPSGDLPL